jgi:ribonuclease HII
LIDSDLQKKVAGWLAEWNGDSGRVESMLRCDGLKTIAGVDEAGRGPLAGPVVAAAVVLPADCSLAGIRDSKLLSPAQRLYFAREIGSAALGVGIGIVEPDEIDRVNILQATNRAIAAAVAALPLVADLLLIDGKYLDAPGCRVVQVVKGDLRCRSVAAASILAKVARDDIMVRLHEIYPRYGFDRHKGYPTKAHKEAIRKYGFSPVHRRTFNAI